MAADSLVTDHQFLGLEESFTPTGLKYRWLCSCGAKGLFVGCAAFDGKEWATGAFRFHQTKLNYEVTQ